MAIVKRGKAYQAKVYLGAGKRRCKTFRTEREAKEWERALLTAGSSGRMTVAEFATTWLAQYPRPKESTNLFYAQQIKGFVAKFGTAKLGDLTRTGVRQWAIAHRGQAEVARTMLADAERDGLVRENVLAKMRLPGSRGRKDIVALTSDDIDRLTATAVAVHGDYGREIYGPMIRIAAYTGVRPGELFALRREDLDEGRRVLYVRRQYNYRVAKFTTTKTGISREIQLVPEAVEAFERLHAGEDLLFETKTGVHFTGRVAYFYWYPVRAAFGRPDLDFYELRHYFGTMLARKNLSARVISNQMGNSPQVCEQYIHLTAEEAKAEVRAAFDRPVLHVVGQ